MKAHRLGVVLVAVAAIGLSARPAEAAFDPETADGDVRALIKSNDYAFCTKPDDPLSASAREMCPLAGEIPGCGPLVEACAKPDEPIRLGPFWEKVARFLARAAPYAAWTLIAGLVALVGYLVIRAVRAARDQGLPAGDRDAKAADVSLVADAPVPEDLRPAEALLRRAAEARANGDARGALFLYLAAALRALDDRGAIRITRDRTNGEYVRACQEAAARPELRDLVREVDFVQFGGRDATDDAAALAERRAANIVRPRSAMAAGSLAPLAMLALVALLSSCKGLDAFSHDDPAGRGLLVDLLEKQGAVLSSVPGSLAHLPMNGTKGAVVVLDADQVPLEDETREHLVAWVKQGGALVLAGNPSRWPSEFWAKQSSSCEPPSPGAPAEPQTAKVRVETRDRPQALPDDDDDDDDVAVQSIAPPHLHHATLARRATMTWPNEDRAPRAIARLEDKELYGALHAFGKGKVLGLASGDLLTNIGLAVPGNAAAVVALLGALDRNEFAIARREQGIAPPDNPLAGLVHVGLGPALVHAALFIPLLFLAYGVRQAAPRAEPPARRRAFAEHVQAVGGLYARRRASSHALAVYAKHVDDRVRAAMGRGNDPVEFLATRSGTSLAATAELHARASTARATAPRPDDLKVLAKLSGLYVRAIAVGRVRG